MKMIEAHSDSPGIDASAAAAASAARKTPTSPA
jgi:hypothetical protein